MDVFDIILLAPILLYVYAATHVFFAYINPVERKRINELFRKVAGYSFITFVICGLLYAFSVYGGGYNSDFLSVYTQAGMLILGFLGILIVGPLIVLVRSRDKLTTTLYISSVYTIFIIALVLLGTTL